METVLFPFKLKSHPDRLLKDHLNSILKIALGRFDHCRFSFPDFSRKDLRKVLEVAALFHDFGKSTTWFQRYVENPESSVSAKERALRRHGLISAFITFGVLADLYPEDSALPAFGFIIVRRHHGNLEAYRNLLTVIESDFDLCRQQSEKID